MPGCFPFLLDFAIPCSGQPEPPLTSTLQQDASRRAARRAAPGGDNANPLADYLKDRPESKKHGAKPGGFAFSSNTSTHSVVSL